MKTVVRFAASDGREFSSVEECLQYEADGCVKFRAKPSYVDLMLLTDDAIHYAISGDGDGYYATADKVSDRRIRLKDHPAWATHIAYFGK